MKPAAYTKQNFEFYWRIHTLQVYAIKKNRIVRFKNGKAFARYLACKLTFDHAPAADILTRGWAVLASEAKEMAKKKNNNHKK